MKTQPILILTLAFALGIFFQDKVVFTDNEVIILLIFGLLFQFIFILKKRWIRQLRGFILGAFFFAIGVLAHSVHNRNNFNFDKINQLQSVNFELEEVYKTNKKFRKYKVKVDQNNGENFNLLLYVSKDYPKLNFSKQYLAQLRILSLPSSLNDEFNYKEYLGRRGIYYQSFLYEKPLSLPKKEFSITDKLKERREKLLRLIDDSALSHSTKMIMKSLVLADKTELDSEIYNDFKKVGIVHVLAISGMHIAILFGFFYAIFSFILKSRKVSILLSLVSIGFFCVFIGLGNSVFRAFLMLSIYYVFYFLQRKQDFLHTWSLSAFLILLLNTQQLFDVGFQLSFIAVFGIYWLYKPFLALFSTKKYRSLKAVFQILSVTLSAQVAVLPLLLYYFHSFSLVGIIANLFFVPIIEIVVILSFVMLFILPFSDTLSLLIKIYDVIIQYLLEFIHLFSTFKWGYLDDISFHYLEMLLMLGLVFMLRNLLKDFSVKEMIKFSYLFLLLIGLRLGINYYYAFVN